MTPFHSKSTYSAYFGVWLDFEMLTYAEYAPLSQSSTSLKIVYYLRIYIYNIEKETV